MGNVLKGVDKVGTEVGFNFGRKPRFQTILGGIMTIVAYFFIIFVTITFGTKLFSSKEVEVSISESYSGDFPKINLFDNNFYPVIGISGPYGFVESDDFPDYLLIIGQIVQQTFTSIEKQDFSEKVLKDFAFFPCKEIKDNVARDTLYKASVHFKDFAQFHGLCADLKPEELPDLFVENNLVDPPNTWFRIVVLPCPDATGASCASEEELNQTELSIILPKGSFDPENASQPISILGSLDESLYLQSKMRYAKDIRLKTVEVYDDKYDFFKETLNTRFAEVDTVKNLVTTRPNNSVFCDLAETDEAAALYCQPYVYINIRSGGKLVTIKREYAKIFNVLGELGGFSDLMIVCFSFLYLASRCKSDSDEVK